MASALSPPVTLTLSASLTPEGLVLPIVEGQVELAGVELTLTAQKSIDKNTRAMLEGRFELCEMSLATFIKARVQGLPIVGLPAFTGRRFLQPMVIARGDARIRAIRDLAGKRIGLPQYWMTSSIWHRGILEELYGVAPDRIEWVTTAPERIDGMDTPRGVTVRHVPCEGGPAALLTRGEVDCVMLPKAPKRAPDWTSPFPDLVDAQIEYYELARIFPIMHLVVMSETLAVQQPNLPFRLMEWLSEAKRRASLEPPIAGLEAAHARTMFGADAYPYGVEANRRTLETFIRYAHRQRLIAEPIRLDALFAV